MRIHLILLLMLGLTLQAVPQAFATPQPEVAPLCLNAPEATQDYLATVPKPWTRRNLNKLVEALNGLEAHGLNPQDYHLAQLSNKDTPAAELQILATDAWFSAAAHMLNGKVDPVTVEPDWTVARREADLKAALRQALKSDSIATSLTQFQPKQPGYAALLAEYGRLREEAAIPLFRIEPGPALRSGQEGARVTQLIARLKQLDLLDATATPTRFDDTVKMAVEVFQIQQELDADGIVGPATIAALNRGNQEKIDQVRVNLERWRWLPDDLGRRHLRVNIADFTVKAFQDGVAERTHLIIVGKHYRKTPVFSGEIEYIVFNPWWETPRSLARADKLPMFQKDPSAVSRLGFQIIDQSGRIVDPASIDWNSLSASNMPYRMRQAPGDQNALGQVKIMFPNPHNVYMHDTPTKGLFAQRQRAFSSGCLRTQDPIDLSEWLLSETENWPREIIDQALDDKREMRANLASKVPVHILYFTVVSEDAGSVRYLDDIYGRDAAVLAGLRAKPR